MFKVQRGMMSPQTRLPVTVTPHGFWGKRPSISVSLRSLLSSFILPEVPFFYIYAVEKVINLRARFLTCHLTAT